MLACPNCTRRLARRVTGKGVVHACPGCGGVSAGLAVLRNEHVATEFIGRAWQAARQETVPQGRPCPHCGRRMALVPVDTGGRTLELDVCKPCSCVWFDPGEWGALPTSPPPPQALEPELSPEAREANAMAKVEEIGRQHEDSGRGPD